MIDLTVVPDKLERVLQRARERGIIIPTFAQLNNCNSKSLTGSNPSDFHIWDR